MALPTNAIIYTGDGYPPSQMEGGRSLPIYPWLDHEYGPLDQNDASLGLTFQVWSAEIIDEGTKIKLWAENVEPFILHEGTNITSVSISFDINANLNCVFTENGLTRLYWYDTVAQETNIKDFGILLDQAKISLDDKYDTSGNSDLIVAYIKNHQIYYRLQRNRYDVEYKLKSDRLVLTLHKIGMGVNGRFQIIVHNSNDGVYLNKVNLLKQIILAEDILTNESLYYLQGWEVFVDIYNEAIIINKSNAVTTSDYTRQGKLLETAINRLRLIPDISRLEWIKEYLLLVPDYDGVQDFLTSTVVGSDGTYPNQKVVDGWVEQGVLLYNKAHGAGLCPKLPTYKILV